MPEPTDRWKQTLLDDPALFIVTYFSHRINKLEDFHLRLIESATQRTRALILYPAGHGKTTLVSTLLPIWALCKDPNIRIAIIGKNEHEGQAIMGAIQTELVDNPDLIRDFGPFKPEPDDQKPWALGRLSVAKRTRRDPRPTIAVFGSGSKQVLGHRTDWTICDDVVTGENSNTPEQRQKIRNWFDQAVETGPEFPDSRLTVVGTRFDPNDLYGDLIEMAVPADDDSRLVKIWQSQREDAVVDEENRIPLWPERWPWKRLMQQKVKVGTLNFNKRYRNIAVDASRMVFKEEYVKGGWIGNVKYDGCLDRNHRIGDYNPQWRIVAGFDPAVGGTRNAKFCAHLVVAMGSCRDHERCLWVIDMNRDQMTLPQQVDQIITKHQQYNLFASVVEANSYQAGLLQAIEDKTKERDLVLNIVPHYTNRTNKPDPELGVQSMSPWFERGQVHIPWGDSYSQRVMGQLVEELIMYPDSRTTDTVMGLWFGWRHLESTAPKFGSVNRLEKQAPLWHRRLGRKIVKNPAYL